MEAGGCQRLWTCGADAPPSGSAQPSFLPSLLTHALASTPSTRIGPLSTPACVCARQWRRRHARARLRRTSLFRLSVSRMGRLAHVSGMKP